MTLWPNIYWIYEVIKSTVYGSSTSTWVRNMPKPRCWLWSKSLKLRSMARSECGSPTTINNFCALLPPPLILNDCDQRINTEIYNLKCENRENTPLSFRTWIRRGKRESSPELTHNCTLNQFLQYNNSYIVLALSAQLQWFIWPLSQSENPIYHSTLASHSNLHHVS